MQQVFGRFNALPLTTGGLLFARLLTNTTLQLLHTTTAYTADLSPSAVPPPTIRNSTEPPTAELLSLLLAIPGTTATLLPAEIPQNTIADAKRLVLSCTDRAGLELNVTLPLLLVPAKPVLDEVHGSLFAAVVGLEALLREFGGEKDPTVLGGDNGEAVCLETVKNGILPLVVKGESVEKQASFRRASAVDERVQGNRAFVFAHLARGVRNTLLEQRRLRREAETERKRRARDLMKKARKRAEEVKRKGEGGRKRSLFEDGGVDERGDSTTKGRAEDGDMPKLRDEIPVDSRVPTNVCQEIRVDKRKVDGNSAVNSAAVAAEHAVAMPADATKVDPVELRAADRLVDAPAAREQQVSTTRPPSKKRRKKRQLV